MLVEPLETELIFDERDGKKYPKPNPMAMDENIQTVRYRSKNFNLVFIPLISYNYD